MSIFRLRRRPFSLLAVALFAVGLLPTSAFAQDLAGHQKLDTALDDVVHNPGGTPSSRRVIIQASAGARALIRQTLVASGHHIQSDLNLINGLAVDLSPAELEALTHNP